MSTTSDRVFFFDTTLRDGEQSPGCTMHHEEKLRFAHQLGALGVDIIEAGFPIASDGDFASVQAIAREVRGPRIAALARCKTGDIERAARAVEGAGSNRIHTFIASSDLHLEAKLRITRQQALDQTGECVRLAKTYTEDVEFSAEDATRSDREFLVQMVEIAIAAGATTINLPDTVGYSTPAEYRAMFESMCARFSGAKDVIFSTHCHDDLGLAVINTVSGVEGGARQVEVSMHGIGERAGNAALEEVAALFKIRHDQYPFSNNLKMDEIGATSKMLDGIISFAPSPNKAIVGKNAFAHASGIHQHGMLANPLTYEIMKPAIFGVDANTIVLGKHSGRRALEHRLKELGFDLNKDEVEQTYTRFTALADRKKNIYDQDIVALVPQSVS
ncbi:isopropylmalate/homocitrate/citramalate synthase [Terriglobus roseus DSM 18391]|uniref:2-isopropylmalate synthase n=1 Tax=Terriglobus roseus (strain DSM 18391 / NRRL B-41598 / KBS 63) TaxID=926566 RepID=I3ZKC0_TERRK|nr:2-isopropylmalate synthase [Terriglobus roseus]AFL89688.1 isopropylmalate/homocitrate/citramalate synthase [Terriglobus roseus DSM 18391]